MKNAKTSENESKHSSALLPNAFQVPNIFIDKYCGLLSPEENMCLYYACRHILGWRDKIHERRRRMSLSFFEHGFGKFGGCGLCRRSIITALSGLSTFGFLIKIGEANTDGQEWEIASDESQIDFTGLIKRHEERKSKNKERTARGRTIQECNKSVNHTGESDSPDAVNGTHRQHGESDSPDAVNGTHQDRLVGLTEGGESDSHNQNQYSKPTFKTKRKDDSLVFDFQKIWEKPNGKMSKAELIVKWWDEIGRVEFEKVESYDPGILMNREEINALGEIVSDKKIGFEGLTRVYKNYLTRNGFYAEQHHKLHWFLKRFQEFTGPAENKNALALNYQNENDDAAVEKFRKKMAQRTQEL